MEDQKKSAETQNRTHQGEVPQHPHKRHMHWIWPVGLAVAGLGGAAAFLLRGCWHTHMGWPLAYDDEYSYQVCTSCGIKRLYDEKKFRAYGPYGYDLHELIARDRAAHIRWLKRKEEAEAHKKAKREPEVKSGTEA